MRELDTGFSNRISSPGIVLRETIIKKRLQSKGLHKINSIVIMAMSIIAWNSFRDNREIKSINNWKSKDSNGISKKFPIAR